MILKEPYEFKSLNLVNNSQTILNINKYIVTDYIYIKERDKLKVSTFSDLHTTLNPVFLYGLSDIEKDIPPFNHPIINVEGKWIAVDLRQVTKLNSTKENYEVKNDSEYNLAIQRFVLSGMWFIGKQSSIYSLKFPHFAYATWLSDNLVKRFGLDLNNQIQLRILALIYYAKLFTNDFNDDDFNKLVIRLKEDIIVPSLMEEVYSKITKLDNIDDFCTACYEVTGNIRLKNLDYNVLLSILSNNWIGLNSKELVLLALDHPPTWVSIVYCALTQRSFKKNYITAVVEKSNKRGSGEDFLKSLIYMTREYKE